MARKKAEKAKKSERERKREEEVVGGQPDR